MKPLLLLNSKHYPLSPRTEKTGFTLTSGGLEVTKILFVQGMQFLIFNFNIINDIFVISAKHISAKLL
jgi:hypothetical protein